MGLILQDNSRTLTDRDVDAVVADVVAVIEREHRARIGVEAVTRGLAWH